MQQQEQLAIVGKEILHAEGIQETLLSEGFAMMYFPACQEALDHILDIANACAVLIDFDESEKEIILLLSELKKLAQKTIIFIAVGTFNLNDFRSAVMAGFHEYLAKPLGKDNLISILRRAGKCTSQIKHNGNEERQQLTDSAIL
ncbi:MAG TPA: hypothetical protein PKE03_11290 [Bacteroidales bacterium]|nr:hypothetical protein [Bacteroidales bacterium]